MCSDSRTQTQIADFLLRKPDKLLLSFEAQNLTAAMEG